jgi:hypothetical protein
MSLSHAPCPISELRMFDTVGARRKARTKGSTASVQSIWKTPKMCCSCTHMSVWKGRPPVFQASPVATAHGPLLCVLLLYRASCNPIAQATSLHTAQHTPQEQRKCALVYLVSSGAFSVNYARAI